MPVDQPAPWAPVLPEGSRPTHEDFRSGRMLCDDGFCLGVMRVADDGAPYRAVPEAVCPICGSRAPISGQFDARRP